MKNIDSIPKQINLSMSIVELSNDGRSYIGKNNNKGVMSDALNAMKPIGGPLQQITLTQTAYEKFLDSVTFLASTGEAEMKAKPNILVLEGEEAVVKSSMQHVLFQGQADGSKPMIISSDVGFRIIPMMADNNNIILKIIEAKLSDLNKESINGIEINEQIIGTTIRVKPGEAIMIGGIFKDKKRKVINKTPILGDIPLLGWFFKTETEQLTKFEVLFTIKPKVHCNI